MKTYIQPQIVIENLAHSYAVCYTISDPNKAIQGFGAIGGGGGPR